MTARADGGDKAEWPGAWSSTDPVFRSRSRGVRHSWGKKMSAICVCKTRRPRFTLDKTRNELREERRGEEAVLYILTMVSHLRSLLCHSSEAKDVLIRGIDLSLCKEIPRGTDLSVWGPLIERKSGSVPRSQEAGAGRREAGRGRGVEKKPKLEARALVDAARGQSGRRPSTLAVMAVGSASARYQGGMYCADYVQCRRPIMLDACFRYVLGKRGREVT